MTWQTPLLWTRAEQHGAPLAILVPGLHGRELQEARMALRYRMLAKSGLWVSENCLGTMSFGDQWGFGADAQ